MSDTTLPSWRVRPPERARAGWGIPPKLWMILGGLAGSVALAALIIWAMGQMGPRGVPLIEADSRPFRVRPEGAPAAPSPPPEMILDRHARPEAMRAPPAPAAPAQRPAAPAAGQPAPAQPAPAQPAGGQARPAAPAAQAQRPAAPQGRAMIQLGALRSEEAARQEWERLRARVPELAGRSPVISRFEREGQPPLWRLRVGGLADREAARALCEQVRARGGACVVPPG